MTSKKPSKPKSKKTTTTAAAISKKVKRTVSARQVVETVSLAPAVIEAAPVVLPVEQAPLRTMSRAEFMVLVRREAYNRAARRHFRNGSPFQDWVNAEAAVSGKLAAEGVRPELS